MFTFVDFKGKEIGVKSNDPDAEVEYINKELAVFFVESLKWSFSNTEVYDNFIESTKTSNIDFIEEQKVDNTTESSSTGVPVVDLFDSSTEQSKVPAASEKDEDPVDTDESNITVRIIKNVTETVQRLIKPIEKNKIYNYDVVDFWLELGYIDLADKIFVINLMNFDDESSFMPMYEVGVISKKTETYRRLDISECPYFYVKTDNYLVYIKNDSTTAVYKFDFSDYSNKIIGSPYKISNASYKFVKSSYDEIYFLALLGNKTKSVRYLILIDLNKPMTYPAEVEDEDIQYWLNRNFYFRSRNKDNDLVVDANCDAVIIEEYEPSELRDITFRTDITDNTDQSLRVSFARSMKLSKMLLV